MLFLDALEAQNSGVGTQEDYTKSENTWPTYYLVDDINE